MPNLEDQIAQLARSRGWYIYRDSLVTLALVRSPRLVLAVVLQENERLTLDQQELGKMLTPGDNEYFVWRSCDIESIKGVLDSPRAYEKTTADRIRIALEVAPQRPSMDDLGTTLGVTRQRAHMVLTANAHLHDMWLQLPESEPMMVYQFCASCGEFTETRKHNYLNTQADPMVAYCGRVCRLRERRKAVRREV